MSVHYSPQQQVLRNISVGKTPITVNVSSVEHGGDYTVHHGASNVQYPVIGETVNNSKEDAPKPSEYVPPPPGYQSKIAGNECCYFTCPHCQCSYPSVCPQGLAANQPMFQERSVDLSVGNDAVSVRCDVKRDAELEGIVHQIFANMALQHQTPHMRKLTGNHIVLPREDLITVVAYTVGCNPSDVRINQGFHDVGCLSKNDGMTLVDSIKIGIKDLYLAYNDKYNLLEDVYHISLHYCFDLDAKGKPRNHVAISYG